MEIKIKRNPQYEEGRQRPRYFFEVNLAGLVKSGGWATLPVYWRPNRAPHPILKEFYWVEVAGMVVEKGNLLALEGALPGAIEALLGYGTLPYYFLDVPGRGRTPVYLVDGKLRARLGDGPQFISEDIGQLWQRLGDYLERTREVAAREEIGLDLLFWKEMRVYPQAFFFGDSPDRACVPIFYREGQLNYDIIGQPSRLLPLEEAFSLKGEVARGLVAARRIPSTFDLKMERVRGEVWEGMKKTLTPTDLQLSYYENGSKIDLSVFEVSQELLALRAGDRSEITFGRDIEDLKRRVAQDLARKGKFSGGSYLEIEKGRR